MARTRIGGPIQVGSAAGKKLSAGRVLDGTHRVYYAPDQLINALPQVYAPPTLWPEAGMLARIPKCVRFLFPRNSISGGSAAEQWFYASDGPGTGFDLPDPGLRTPEDLIVEEGLEPYIAADYDDIEPVGAFTEEVQIPTAVGSEGNFDTFFVAWMANPDYDPEGGDDTAFARVAEGLEILEDTPFVYVWGVEYDEEDYLSLLAPPSGLTDYFTTNVLQIVIAKRSSLYLDSGEPAAEYVAARSQIAEHYDNFAGYAVWLYADASVPGDSETDRDENIAFMGNAVSGSGAYAGAGLGTLGFSYKGTVDWETTTAADFLAAIRTHFGI